MRNKTTRTQVTKVSKILHFFREFRYLCYRSLCWLIYQRPLGRGIRIPLPDCCVQSIRSAYPSDTGIYTGFKRKLLDTNQGRKRIAWFLHFQVPLSDFDFASCFFFHFSRRSSRDGAETRATYRGRFRSKHLRKISFLPCLFFYTYW